MAIRVRKPKYSPWTIVPIGMIGIVLLAIAVITPGIIVYLIGRSADPPTPSGGGATDAPTPAPTPLTGAPSLSPTPAPTFVERVDLLSDTTFPTMGKIHALSRDGTVLVLAGSYNRTTVYTRSLVNGTFLSHTYLALSGDYTTTDDYQQDPTVSENGSTISVRSRYPTDVTSTSHLDIFERSGSLSWNSVQSTTNTAATTRFWLFNHAMSPNAKYLITDVGVGGVDLNLTVKALAAGPTWIADPAIDIGHRFSEEIAQFYSIQFSEDASRVAVMYNGNTGSGYTNTFRVFSIGAGETVTTLNPHPVNLGSKTMAFSYDGKTVVSANSNFDWIQISTEQSGWIPTYNDSLGGLCDTSLAIDAHDRIYMMKVVDSSTFNVSIRIAGVWQSQIHPLPSALSTYLTCGKINKGSVDANGTVYVVSFWNGLNQAYTMVLTSPRPSYGLKQEVIVDNTYRDLGHMHAMSKDGNVLVLTGYNGSAVYTKETNGSYAVQTYQALEGNWVAADDYYYQDPDITNDGSTYDVRYNVPNGISRPIISYTSVYNRIGIGSSWPRVQQLTEDGPYQNFYNFKHALSPDGKYIVVDNSSVSTELKLLTYQRTSGTNWAINPSMDFSNIVGFRNRSFSTVKFSTDGKRLAVIHDSFFGGGNIVLNVVDIPSLTSISGDLTVYPVTGSTPIMAISHDGNFVALAHRGTSRLWMTDAASGWNVTYDQSLGSMCPNSLAMDSHNRVYMIGELDGSTFTIHMYDSGVWNVQTITIPPGFSQFNQCWTLRKGSVDYDGYVYILSFSRYMSSSVLVLHLNPS